MTPFSDPHLFSEEKINENGPIIPAPRSFSLGPRDPPLVKSVHNQ